MFILQISEIVDKCVDLSYPLKDIFKNIKLICAQPKIVTYRVHAQGLWNQIMAKGNNYKQKHS